MKTGLILIPLRNTLYILFFLFIGAGFGCGGCACPSNHGYETAEAYRSAEFESRQSKAQPVINALEKYHVAHECYPATLDQLVHDKLLDAIPDLSDTNDHQNKPGRIASATPLRYVRQGGDGHDDYALDFGCGFTETGWMGAGSFTRRYCYSWDPRKWISELPRPAERDLPRSLAQRYQGRTAAEWGGDLLGGNDQASLVAAEALRAIGPEGLRFVLDGLRSPSHKVRERSIRIGLDPELARIYPDAFLPTLKACMTVPEATVRSAAAEALPMCWSARSIWVKEDVRRELQQRADVESDPATKDEMMRALATLAALPR